MRIYLLEFSEFLTIISHIRTITDDALNIQKVDCCKVRIASPLKIEIAL